MTRRAVGLRLRLAAVSGVALLVVAALGVASAAAADGGVLDPVFPLGEKHDIPRLSDKPIPYQPVPTRPPLPLELGCDFLGKGKLPPGIELPGGAVWTPCLWVFGTFRTALQTYESQGAPGRNTEWANRLDVFANLQLTSTEKCVVGISPLDKNNFTRFTRYSFESNRNREGWQNETGVFVRTAFCEGDFGSLVPDLDPKGTKLIDWGFSVGRQQITFQEGLLINDVLDGVGVVRNNLHLPGFSNIRATAFYAWNGIDRGPGSSQIRQDNGGFYGLFLQGDTMASTWALDLITIQDSGNRAGGDGYWLGLSTTQRGLSPFNGVGEVNTTYRINGSLAGGDETDIVTNGLLLTAEFSWTPHASDDIVYFNTGWGIGRYSQASHEPILGGPLTPLGISFASNSLGDFLSELNSFGTQAVLAVLGYQAFWDDHRRNLVLELAGVKDTSRNLFSTQGEGSDAAAFTVQFQQAIGKRVQLQLDGFVAYLESRKNGSGARFEILVQF